MSLVESWSHVTFSSMIIYYIPIMIVCHIFNHDPLLHSYHDPMSHFQTWSSITFLSWSYVTFSIMMQCHTFNYYLMTILCHIPTMIPCQILQFSTIPGFIFVTWWSLFIQPFPCVHTCWQFVCYFRKVYIYIYIPLPIL